MYHHGIGEFSVFACLGVVQSIFADDDLLTEGSERDVACCSVGSWPRGLSEVFCFCGFINGACRFVGIDR